MQGFGEYLRTLRSDAGKTQAELAEAIGVSNAYVSAIEKGKKPAPPRALVNALAGVLGVDEVALWTVAQREREERLRRRIEGFPRSQGRSVYEAASESLPRADRLDRAIDLLQRVKDPQGRTRLAEAVEGLVGVSCGSR